MHGCGIREGIIRTDLVPIGGVFQLHVKRFIPGKRHAIGVAYDLDANIGNTLRLKSDTVGCGVGEVNDAAVHERAAIGHTDHDALAVILIGDTDNRPYWKRTVCGRECVHVIGKSGRCRPGIKIPAVPGRLAPHNIRVLSDTVKPDIMLVPGAFFSGRRGSRVSFLKILSHKCRSFLLADMRIRLRMAPLCKIPPQRFGVTGGGVSPECQRADKRAREDKQRETKF